MTKINPAFRPEKMRNYSPVFDGVPPLALNETADSGEIVCIKTSVNMLPYLIGAWELFRYDYVVQGEDEEREHTHAQLKRLLDQIIMSDACEPCAGGGGGGGGGVYLPDCVSTRQENGEFYIDIKDCCDMTVIVNINDCCCGGDNGGSFGGGVSGGGGASGSWETIPESGGVLASNAVSQCDFVTTMIPLILGQMEELLVTIDNFNANGEDALEALEEATDGGSLPQDVVGFLGEIVSGVLQAGSAATLAMIRDNDFEFRFMEAWIKAHGNDGSITSVNYSMLNSITRYLPLTWIEAGAVIFPRLLFPILFRAINYGKMNSRLILAKNTRNTGLCEYIWAGAEMSYDPPLLQSSFPNPLSPIAYEWARVYDFTVDEQGWIDFTNNADYVAGVGWGTDSFTWNIAIKKQYDGSNGDLKYIRVYFDTPNDGLTWKYYHDGSEKQSGAAPSVGVFDMVIDSAHWDFANYHGVYLRRTDSYPDLTGAHITKLEIWGDGVPMSGGSDLYG